MSAAKDAQSAKVFKKGDHLFKAGDPCKDAFLIQSGVVQVYLQKGKGKTELCQVRGPQTLGLECLIGIPSFAFSALVLSDVKAIVIPAPHAAAAYAGGAQLMRLFLKTAYEREKGLLQDLKSFKGGADDIPCPADQTSKVFAAIFHTARYKGETKDGKTTVSWDAFKQYAQRTFLEPPIRIENACNIFVKLGSVSYTMVPDETDPEAPPKIEQITFTDLPLIEAFFEWFAHFYFKSANPAFFKVDDRCVKFVNVILAATQDARLDRGGVVNAVLTETLEKVNAAMGTTSTDYLALIESKGLFAKKTANNKGGLLQFHRSEFESVLRFWRVLKEIERWNENGSVSLEVETEAAASLGAGTACPECSKPLDGSPNFCGHCGHKLKSAA